MAHSYLYINRFIYRLGGAVPGGGKGGLVTGVLLLGSGLPGCPVLVPLGLGVVGVVLGTLGVAGNGFILVLSPLGGVVVGAVWPGCTVSVAVFE